MTYQEFKENVTTVIQNRLGSNVKVTIQEIIKNNDTHYCLLYTSPSPRD